MRRLAVIWGLLGIFGCGGNSGPIDDVPVRSAQIAHLNWSSVEVIAGATWTDGVLTIVDTSGQSHVVNVKLSGPDIGVVFDVSAVTLGNPTIDLVLPQGKAIRGRDLVGSYFGKKADVHIALGIDNNQLSNSSGVKMSGSAFNLGVGVFVGAEWLALSVK